MLRQIGIGIVRVVIVLLSLVAVAAIALLIVTNTDWGRERARRFAVNFLQDRVNGRVTIGRLSGNLLTGVTIHDFAIRDSTGAPFMVADAVTATYRVGSLLSKRLWFDDVTITRPLVLLDHPPKGEWNYKRIFRSDTTTAHGPPSPWTQRIQFTDMTVIDGHLIVRTPWSPSERLTPAARDSAVRATLEGKSRLMVVRVPAGFQKIVELQHLNAKAPLLRLSDPNERNRLAKVASLNMTAFPFRPPPAVVRDLRGNFLFNDDSLWWSNAYAEMPGSRISGNGRYTLDNGDMTLVLRGAPASLADLRWVYPRLPSDGEGTLDFRMDWVGATQTYVARNADVRVRQARVSGNFGFTMADTVTIHDTDLRLANFDTRLLEQLLPHFNSPRRGAFSGRIAAAGGQHAMRLDGDLSFADARDGTSRVVMNGVVGFGNGMRMRDLRLRLEPAQVELARTYLKNAPISGTLSGDVLLNGDTKTTVVASGTLRHVDRGAVSEVTGRATIRGGGGGSPWFDVDATARPLSLVEVGRFAPSVGLQGYVSGPIRATGTMDRLALRADLRLPDGGVLNARGTVALGGTVKRYDLAAAMQVVNLRTVLAKAPRTSLTARAAARGSGTNLATMQASLSADLATSSWDSVAVDSGSVRVTLANGMAHIDRLRLSSAYTQINASGTFGLLAGREGELSYHVQADSLGAFNRWLPHSASDTGVVAPRPSRVVSAIRRARADSARIDRATEVERAIRGGVPPKLVVDTPKAVPRDTLAGKVYAAGTIRGNIKRFDMRGRAGGENIVAFGSSMRRFQTEYAWTNARTPQSLVAIGLTGDTVSVAGFAFDSIDVRLGYQKPKGRVEMVVRQGSERDYALKGDFLLNKDGRELRIADLALRFDTTRWVASHPSTIRWYGSGITVDNFELRDGGAGRIFVNGLLPTQGVANLELAVENFHVENLLDLLESDIEMKGVISLAGRLEGTMSAPTFHGAYGLAAASYRGATVPDAHGTFAYANERLTTQLNLMRSGGAAVTTASATLPINLAFTGVTGPRMLDRPLAADINADSLPLELVPYFTDMVSQVNGLAVGRIAVRGTLKHPSIVGGLALTRGTVTITATGMRVTNVAASVRMVNDSIYIDSIAGQSRGPIKIRGAIAVASLSNPVFDLYIVANDAEVLKNDRGRLRADIGLAANGPLHGATLSGQVTVTQGVIYVPEPTGKRVINAGDPALFSVVDTTLESERNLFPTGSTLFQTTRLDVALVVNRNTWVRSKDMNIEVFTEGPVQIRSFRGNPSLLGTITTDRGEYEFLSKRFQISRGSATFVGSRDLNPSLQVTGEYQVQLASAPAITIKVLIGGTLMRPKLSLESDAQPPRSQSELLSLLAFGRSTSDLLQGEGNSFVGGATPGDVVGIGAQLAVRRLAGVALGVAVQQLETEAGRGLGVDVFDITPSDVPTQLEGGNSVANFLKETRVEAGKYVNPRTFLGLQVHASYLGARVTHRDSRGFLYQTYWEPRVLLREPSLSGQSVATTSAFGMALIREWRF
jgi:translocation and assembly module TamB